MFASLVLSCGKSTRKMGFCRDECGSSHQGVQDPNATLTKQRVESSHSEVRGCGLPSDELFRFIETQIREGKVRQTACNLDETNGGVSTFGGQRVWSAKR